MAQMELTAKRIKALLMRERHLKHFVLPEYTPRNWFSCDVWELTKAGYGVEYEVKVTRRDFEHDQMKMRRDREDQTVKTKHRMLEAGHLSGPSRFYFVMPMGMIEHALVPDWAGLIEIVRSATGSTIHEHYAKMAPTLHKQKVDAQIVAHARTIPYWRFHTLAQALSRSA